MSKIMSIDHNYRTNLMLSSAEPEHRIWPKWSKCLVHTRKLWRLQQLLFCGFSASWFFSGSFSVNAENIQVAS